MGHSGFVPQIGLGFWGKGVVIYNMVALVTDVVFKIPIYLLKLILCGFHEATLALQSAFNIIYPEKKYSMKYTTVNGVQGFEEPAEVKTS
ncbi:hypothetical protein GCM10025777_26980 [Membranihabitans marinus]